MVTLRSALMDIITRPALLPVTLVVAAALTVAALMLGATGASAAAEDVSERSVTLAVGDHERRPIAPTQRDQLGLVLYGFMALIVVAGGATLRRQIKGERPQTDGEFRWR
jgi:hypothetical protein